MTKDSELQPSCIDEDEKWRRENSLHTGDCWLRSLCVRRGVAHPLKRVKPRSIGGSDFLRGESRFVVDFGLVGRGYAMAQFERTRKTP